MDRETGVFADHEKVHLRHHRGKYFNVRDLLPAASDGVPFLISVVGWMALK